MRASLRCLAASLRRYDALLASGCLQPDAAQASAVRRLALLNQQLGQHSHAVAAHALALAAWESAREAHVQRLLQAAEPTPPPARGWLASVLSQPAAPDHAAERARAEAQALAALGAPPAPPRPPRGVYLYGAVGVGKTLVMDAFFEAAVEVLGEANARRVHFNAFANSMHWHLHTLAERQRLRVAAEGAAELQARAARSALLAARRRRGQALATAPASSGAVLANAAVLAEVAAALLPCAGGPAVLCFDEFAVSDAFTAVSLKGVLESLLQRGVTVVLTSNRAPRDMHAGAAQQRELFDQFADTLEAHCEPWCVDSTVDYRAASAQGAASPVAFCAADAADAAAMEALYAAACMGGASAPAAVPVLFGRTLRIPRACGGIARASFDELCSQPLGTADYIALSERFHTVFLDDVPLMPAGAADVARRFITLVDELYNARCVLVFASAAPPAALFAGSGGDADGAPLVDIEGLQFEGEAEFARSRRDVARDGGVAPVASTAAAMAGAVASLSGAAERFAFARAVSRLAEMGTASWVRRSRAPRTLQDALLRGREHGS